MKAGFVRTLVVVFVLTSLGALSMSPKIGYGDTSLPAGIAEIIPASTTSYSDGTPQEPFDPGDIGPAEPAYDGTDGTPQEPADDGGTYSQGYQDGHNEGYEDGKSQEQAAIDGASEGDDGGGGCCG
ncbi:MAG: hypothetical protein ABII00_02965 [Elusimicrobiota bacterium]